MAYQPNLKIPRGREQALRMLRDFTDSEWEALQAALAPSPDGLPILSRSELSEQIIEHVDSLTKSQSDALVAALVSLRLTIANHAWPIDKVASDLARSSAIRPQDDVDIDRFVDRIAFALQSVTLSYVAKAVELFVSHDRVLHTAQLVTDIRPVFSVGDEPNPVGAVVVQVLRLDYLDEDGTHSFSIALDRDDIARLRTILQRAESKFASLIDFLGKTGLPVHVPEPGKD